MNRIFLLLLATICTFELFAADDILLAKGERVSGDLTGGASGWQLAGATLKTSEVLCVRFSQDPPPAGGAECVFIRGGSLLYGTLNSLKGDVAEVKSTALGLLKLNRDDLAGYLAALPLGQPENRPELTRYSTLLSATLGTPGAILQPGKRTVVHMANLDQEQAESVLRVGSEQILLKAKDKTSDPINRQYVRLLEIEPPALPPSLPADERMGAEFIVRLKSGDLIRGRVLKLTDKNLTIRTAFMDEKVLDRKLLASMFSAAGKGSDVTWLSSRKPSKSVYTPIFDSEFPARMDSSVGRQDMRIGTLPCERGIGVHARSELEFTLDGQSNRFVSLAGMDAAAQNRGRVIARILADGKEVWKSQTIAGNTEALTISVDLGTAKTLSLIVEHDSDNNDSGDHFDWGWAAVVRTAN